MPIFAHVETESEVQLNDRTRIEATKTHVTQNQPAIAKLTVQPGADSVAYNVFNIDKSKRYLDWEFNAWNIDVDSSCNKIDFQEDSTILSATLATQTYSLLGVANAIAAAMTAATTIGAVYSASLSLDDKITLSSTKGFFLLNKTGANRLVSIINKLFFDPADMRQKTTYTSSRVQFLPKKVTVFAGENRKQVQKVTCVADVSGSLNSTYFFIYALGDTSKFYVWNNINGAGVDPALSGYTGIEVVAATDASASDMAIALASALNGDANFTASLVGNIVTFTHVSSDWNTPAIDSTVAPTGFTFAVSVIGESQSSEYIYVNIFSVAGDYLFCDDADLMQFEPDIRKWIVDGRNSFMNIHRQSQKAIMEWLDREGFVNVYRCKYQKFDLIDISEVKEWSRFIALRMIFEGIKNSQDDLYQQKRATYESKELDARARAILRIDTDKSGDLFLDEGIDTNSIIMGFR